jgi:hypothetical protein
LERGEGLCSLVAEHDSGLTPRMLPNHEYPIPQREPLIGIIRNRRIHRSMSDRRRYPDKAVN